MAGDSGVSLHNAGYPTDVNGDGRVSSIDALAVVNHITRALTAVAEGDLASSFLPGGSNSISPPILALCQFTPPDAVLRTDFQGLDPESCSAFSMSSKASVVRARAGDEVITSRFC